MAKITDICQAFGGNIAMDINIDPAAARVQTWWHHGSRQHHGPRWLHRPPISSVPPAAALALDINIVLGCSIDPDFTMASGGSAGLCGCQ